MRRTTTHPGISDFFRGLSVFATSEHMPFRWEAGGPAALLVHGFPGTPADVLPLGRSLHARGWTVEAPLLPGFGPAIATLPERRYTEWVDVVAHCAAQLKARGHGPIVVLGHSMGGSISLLATAIEEVDAQVLLAPYWRFGHPLHHTLWPLMRPFVGRWRPLLRADFQDERIRRSVLRILPELDLDDPQVQDELRRFVVPTSLLDELRQLGIAAFAAARRTTTYTLVVQGSRDTLVRPGATSKLFLRLQNPAGVELVDGTHNVVKPEDGAWERVEALVLRFTASLISGRVRPAGTLGAPPSSHH